MYRPRCQGLSWRWTAAGILQGARRGAHAGERGAGGPSRGRAAPVVSMPAKYSAAISGSICLSLSGWPVAGSLTRSSMCAKVPLAGVPSCMCLSRLRTTHCAPHARAASCRMHHRPLPQDLPRYKLRGPSSAMVLGRMLRRRQTLSACPAAKHSRSLAARAAERGCRPRRHARTAAQAGGGRGGARLPLLHHAVALAHVLPPELDHALGSLAHAALHLHRAGVPARHSTPAAPLCPATPALPATHGQRTRHS